MTPFKFPQGGGSLFTVVVFSATLFGLVIRRKTPQAEKRSPTNASVLSTQFVFIAGAFFAMLAAAFTEGVFFDSPAVDLYFTKLNGTLAHAEKALFVAAIEEITKVAFFGFCVYFVSRTAKKNACTSAFDQKTNAFVFALFFATFENIAYSLHYPDSPLLRIATATVIHIGVGLWYPEIIRRNKKYFLFAVLLHAVYNFSTSYRPLFFTFGAACLLVCVQNFLRYIKSPTK